MRLTCKKCGSTRIRQRFVDSKYVTCKDCKFRWKL